MMSRRNFLRLAVIAGVCSDDHIVHRNSQQYAQGVEVVDAGEGLPALPFVDGPGFLEVKPCLNIPHAQAAFLTEPDDVFASLNWINRREVLIRHVPPPVRSPSSTVDGSVLKCACVIYHVAGQNASTFLEL